MEPKVLPATKDEHDVGDNLPNPLLNPLLNPTLGRNLGRWADVYYSTPPEKRERAIFELLRELESPEKPECEDEPTVTAKNQKTIHTESQNEALACPTCLHETPAHQHFCGLCGVAVRISENNDPGQQTTTSVPQFCPPPIDQQENDWRPRQEKRLADSRTPHKKSQSWKYVAIVFITITAIILYWQWGMHSQITEPTNASRMDTGTSTISKQVTNQRSSAASGDSKAENRAAAYSGAELSNKPKPAAGKPFGCREDHLESCSVAELYDRTVILANTIDAAFIDYDRRVARLRIEAKAHQNDSAKQKEERLRNGNRYAQLRENLWLRSYVANQKIDALKYRRELLRRGAEPRLENKTLLHAYKNPRLCLDLHYVAENLRRLAAKLPRLHSSQTLPS
jgi:hypothetical protein